jgi:hypothetical protein
MSVLDGSELSRDTLPPGKSPLLVGPRDTMVDKKAVPLPEIEPKSFKEVTKIMKLMI